MKTQHTPTPIQLPVFKQDRYDPSGLMYEYTVVYDGDKYEIARMNDPDYAAFIVRACNAHEELVEILRNLVEAVTEEQCQDHLSICFERADKFLTTLAKARGEA